MMNDPPKVSLSKREYKEHRKEANKEWSRRLNTLNSSLVNGEEIEEKWDPNPRHSLYYQVQLSEYLSADGEWDRFLQTLKSPLPTVFRIGWACPLLMVKRLCHLMCTDYKTMTGRFVVIRGSIVKDDIVKELPWFRPDYKLLWQCVADSSTIKHDSAFTNLSDLLVRESELGHVVRQELASMIPALCLKVQQHHRVLDICAAPGSKTEQIVSLMRAASSNEAPHGVCRGLVVANDADPVRINTLQQRYDRCRSPNLMLTCSKAEDFHDHVQSYMASHPQEATAENTLFDRVVADVPCSGDGTVRKFPHIYRLFRPRYSLDLHVVQLQIAKAAVELLKPRGAGRVVYSTCSLNPLEDEAVLCGLLRHYGRERLRLVDVVQEEGMLVHLKARPGLSEWRIDPDVFLSGEREEDLRESRDRLPRIVPSMHPPSQQERQWMHLERSMRVLPQDMDCGGFFVAVLELIGDRDADLLSSSSSSSVSAAADGPVSSSHKKGKIHSHGGSEGQVDSTEIMKQLGYNPRRNEASKGQSQSKDEKKTKVKKGKDKSRNRDGALGTEQFSVRLVRESKSAQEDTVAVLQQLGFDSALARAPSDLAEQGRDNLIAAIAHTQISGGSGDSDGRARIAKKARVGSASTPLSFLRKAPETPGDAQQREGCKLALVSHELHRALSTWAVPSAPSCSSSFDVVGAGAVLCDYAKSGGGVAAGALQDNSSCVLAGLLLASSDRNTAGTTASATGDGNNLFVLSKRAFAAVVQSALASSEAPAVRTILEEHPSFSRWCHERVQVVGSRALYVVLALGGDHEVKEEGSASADAGGDTDGLGGNKRRLSKAERKRLQRHGGNGTAPRVAPSTVSNTVASGDGALPSLPSTAAVASMVVRVRVHEEAASEELIVEVLAGKDKCQSYLEMMQS